MPAAGRTALYRTFDADDKLLYVGITDGIDVRFKAHQKTSEWWPLMVRRDIEWFPTRRDAMRAEAAAIRDEGAAFNLQRYAPEFEPAWLPRDLAKYSSKETALKSIYRRRRAAEAAQVALEQSIRDGRTTGLSHKDLADHSGLSQPKVKKLLAADAGRPEDG